MLTIDISIDEEFWISNDQMYGGPAGDRPSQLVLETLDPPPGRVLRRPVELRVELATQRGVELPAVQLPWLGTNPWSSPGNWIHLPDLYVNIAIENGH